MEKVKHTGKREQLQAFILQLTRNNLIFNQQKNTNMRNLLLMFAMVGMLFATSCSNDDLDTVQSGDETQVTFSLSLEKKIATRAISDGSQTDKLVYAVFDENGNRISTIQKVEKTDVIFPATETLTLAKGQTYKVAFWAQDADCEAYSVDDNMNVTVSYENALNNDETRDAFFKTETFTVTGSTSIHVELKRPFAQINVGVTEEDWVAAVASGIEIKNSKVVIKDAATKLNLLTGAVSDPTTVGVTYDLATIPAENLMVDVDNDGTKETYHWLSMSYILVNDGSDATPSVDGATKTTLENLEFTFKPESGNEITLKNGLTSVPVQRNWRTNILGKLLTSDITFNISIDPIYDGDYIYPDGSAQELAMAAAYGGTITLQENVVLQEPLKIAAGKSVVINLNGKRITPPTGADRTIQVFDGAELVINGEGTIGSLSGEALAVCVLGGKLTINGGTYYGGSECSCIYLFNSARYDGIQNKGSIEINGGTFKVNAPWNNFYYVLNQQNGSEGTITVKGGTFENYDPSRGDDHDQPTNFVAEGYKSLQKGETYVVVPNEVTDVVSSNEDLDAAISNTEGEAIIALGNNAEISLKSGAANGKSNDFTFIGDGTSTFDVISDTETAEGGQLNYQRGSTFTFQNLTIKAGEGAFDGIVCDELTYYNCTITGKLTLYGKATFINCTFENDMADQYSIWTWGGTEGKFEGCTFNTNGKAILLYGKGPTDLIVSNCTFNDRNNGSAGKAAIEIGNDYNATYSLTTTNCTVNGFADGKNTGSKLWANKNSMNAEHLSVTIDGEKVL